MAKSKKSGKQLRIAGTARQDIIADIEQAAAHYVTVRDQRMELTEEEVQAQQELVRLMDEHKLTSYQCDEEDLTVEMVDKRKAKVKRRNTEEQSEAAA